MPDTCITAHVILNDMHTRIPLKHKSYSTANDVTVRSDLYVSNKKQALKATPYSSASVLL